MTPDILPPDPKYVDLEKDRSGLQRVGNQSVSGLYNKPSELDDYKVNPLGAKKNSEVSFIGAHLQKTNIDKIKA